MRLNLGSNKKKLEGYINVDALKLENVDLVWDLTKIPYPKEMEGAEEIVAIELLEHISFWNAEQVLREWYRILIDGGKLHIQVPDIGKMCEYYMNNQICDCVPHKPDENSGDNLADKSCFNCGGTAKVNPTRWLYAFTGAQKHNFDVHKNVFTKELIYKLLRKVGFKEIKIDSDKYGWKLKCNCIK